MSRSLSGIVITRRIVTWRTVIISGGSRRSGSGVLNPMGKDVEGLFQESSLMPAGRVDIQDSTLDVAKSRERWCHCYITKVLDWMQSVSVCGMGGV